MRSYATPWQGMAAALAVALAACRADPSTATDSPALSDDTYVSVMVGLLLIDARPADAETEEERQAIMDSARAEVLATHDITARELVEFAELVGRDPGRMEDMWHRVTQAFDSTRSAELRLRTEALSEAEGRLGETARQKADSGVVPSPAAGLEVERDSGQPRRRPAFRGRLDSLQRTTKEPPDPRPEG